MHNGATPEVEGPAPEEVAVHDRFLKLLALERAMRDMLRSQGEVEQLLDELKEYDHAAR
ncbi:MAG: hypothetical protein M3N29_00815 [Chloroflexota bacterium]|nr:hypothetical protein [Chloroflexota bacterium]